MPKIKPTAIERLMVRVIVMPNGCWQWVGRKTQDGYGKISGKLAHREIHILHKGEIPKGMELDHVCHDPEICKLGNSCPHRSCVNPDHTVPVTHDKNMGERANKAGYPSHFENHWASLRSMTHCKRGHPLSPENTYTSSGGRGCKVCSYYKAKGRRIAKKLGYM